MPPRQAFGKEKQPGESLWRSEGLAGCKFVSGLYGVEMGFLGRICKGFAPGAVWMAESSERERLKIQCISEIQT